MQNWVITTIPEGEYKQVSKLGDRYVVRLEPTPNDGQVMCYECMTDVPNIDSLTTDLQAWKGVHQERRLSRERKERMKEIKEELAATDYLALKAIEGEDMSGHEGWQEHRAELRREFRELEALENGK